MFWPMREKEDRHMGMRKERQTGICAIRSKLNRVGSASMSSAHLEVFQGELLRALHSGAPCGQYLLAETQLTMDLNVAFERSLEDDRVPPTLQKGRCSGRGPGTQAFVRCSAFIRVWKTSFTKREKP